MAGENRWTPEEDRRLIQMREAGGKFSDIGAVLGRTSGACCNRYKRLGRQSFGPRKNCPWTDAEDEALRKSLLRGELLWQFGQRIGRSEASCRNRAVRLGLVQPKGRRKREGLVYGRRCHDCGKPTSDYRCPRCLTRWRRKHNVPDGGDEEGL